ncbi:hypothetical protein GCM10011512_26250 [Tersicoccus solisilvae]|uniref:Apolipoprotein N-acyltransferase n=1 Tax=Tersicoccus solisilvae TaxID=1882339 RepID=A0ABQ1PJ05_9MICC|nr:DUF6804 family protein [Tersicoccus solisilvae]GGC98036.1 hypothetical protein GCM10011512_26250 [Tersicoccus solisilvae]
MSKRGRVPSPYQRNAAAPGAVAAAALFLAPVLTGAGWGPVVLFLTAILAMIVGWFAVQAKQWWWVAVFALIAVVWNPVFPLSFAGPVWGAAQPTAAVVFLVAGVTIRVRRS